MGEELAQAIRAVRSGNFYVTPLVTKEVVESMLRGVDGGAPSGPELTTVNAKCCNLLAEGHTVKDIAGTLKISPRTVEFHKANHGTAQPAYHSGTREIRLARGLHQPNLISAPSFSYQYFKLVYF